MKIRNKVKGILNISLIFLLMLLFSYKPFVERLDKLFLLEFHRQIYWNSLASECWEKCYVNKPYYDQPYASNLFENNLPMSFEIAEDFKVETIDDGSIILSGSNNTADAIYINVTPSDFFLADGKYIFRSGENVDNGYYSLYLEGITYSIGGTTDYQLISIADDNAAFDINNSSFQRLVCILRIDPGFSESYLQLTPMIYEEAYDDCFQACYTPNAAQNYDSSMKYKSLSLDKFELEMFDEEDWELLKHQVKAEIKSYDWMTIDLTDESSVQLLYDEAEDSLVYYIGARDRVGRIKNRIAYKGFPILSKLLETVEDNNTYSFNEDIFFIDQFKTYLHMIKDDNYSVFISIKDEGAGGLTNLMRTELASLGFKTNFLKLYHHSYIGVIDRGEVVTEIASDDSILNIEGELKNGMSYKIKSAGYKVGNLSSIVLDGVEYSMNRRGMNIVVIDNTCTNGHEAGDVIDTVTFDTHAGLAAYRPFNGIPQKSE